MIHRYGTYQTETTEPSAERLAQIKREIAENLAQCIEKTPYIIKQYSDGHWTIAQKISIDAAETERIEQVDN